MTTDSDGGAGRSLWRFFPHAIIAALGVVVAVNVGMAWAAMSTFPGLAASDVFDRSNAYDKVLDAATREAALGVSLTVQMDGLRPVVVLTAPDAAAATAAQLTARARRPLGPDDAVALHFARSTGGRYVADEALPERGQWDLLFVARVGGQDLRATRRVVIR
jgi:nitrogen fixation protein FixH